MPVCNLVRAAPVFGRLLSHQKYLCTLTLKISKVEDCKTSYKTDGVVHRPFQVFSTYVIRGFQTLRKKDEEPKSDEDPKIDAEVTNYRPNRADNTKTEEDFKSALLDYYEKKAYDDLEYMDDVDYHDLQHTSKRLFYKIVDVWLKEVGTTKQGHREFIFSMWKSMKRFNVEADISAYMKLFECFPDGKHLGLKRDHWFKAAWMDKGAEHFLAIRIMSLLVQNGAVPNDKLFNKTTDMFGKFSPATAFARCWMFLYPRFTEMNPHPIPQSLFKELTTVECAFFCLRQMNPGIDSHYHNFAVQKSVCDQALDNNKLDSIISVQTEKQISSLSQHDTSMPIFVEGPFMTYFKSKKVQYFVMRCDPKDAKLQTLPKERTTILTTKEWWTEFYETDWDTGHKPVGRISEEFFPTVDVVDGYSNDHEKIDEIAIVEKDTAAVEGPVYAIACTDYTSPKALQFWVRGLVPQNPILKECSVVFSEQNPFILNAPKDDPNESLYADIELPFDY